MESHELVKSLKDHEAAMKAKIARLAESNDPQRDAIMERVEGQLAAVQKEIRQYGGKPEE